jgi:hypothetical protein
MTVTALPCNAGATSVAEALVSFLICNGSSAFGYRLRISVNRRPVVSGGGEQPAAMAARQQSTAYTIGRRRPERVRAGRCLLREEFITIIVADHSVPQVSLLIRGNHSLGY